MQPMPLSNLFPNFAELGDECNQSLLKYALSMNMGRVYTTLLSFRSQTQNYKLATVSKKETAGFISLSLFLSTPSPITRCC